MSASDYAENALLELVVGKTAFSTPTAYVALCTAAPTDASTGSTITEAAYTSYSRVSTAGSDWNSASAGSIDNANAITFPKCTGGSETLTHFVIVDAASAGNVLLWGALDSSLAVSNNITPEFAAGTLTATCD